MEVPKSDAAREQIPPQQQERAAVEAEQRPEHRTKESSVAADVSASHRAWRAHKPGGKDALVFEQVPLPPLGRNDVRVRILFSGVGLTDKFVVDGTYIYSSLPATPGYEFVGEVVERGPGADPLFKEGAKVLSLCVTGGWAEYATVKDQDLVLVPPFLLDSLELQHVVPLILNYATAYQMLHREALTRNANGKKVLFTGLSGGVGLAFLDLSKSMGMTIYGTASAAKAQLVRDQGGIPIDYNSVDVESVVRAAEPDGLDFVFDSLGGSWSKMGWRLLRKGGSLITFGVTSATSALGSFGAFLLPGVLGLLPGASGTFYGITSLYRKNPNLFKQDLAVLCEMLHDKKIHPQIDSVVPLDEAKIALEKLVSGKVQGKIVIRM